MPRTSITLNGSVAETELVRSTAQANALIASCTAQALSSLTAAQKKQLDATITTIKTIMETGLDIISQRRARLEKRVKLLREELGEVQVDTSTVGNMFILLGPAISACPDVAKTVSTVKATTDRTNAEALELQYRINLITIQQGFVAERLAAGRAALAGLDDIRSLL